MERQFVVFVLDGEYYGVDIALVERIVEMQTIARVPYAPKFIQGITNLYGAILPVIDLRKRFGFAAQAANRDTRLIVVATHGRRIGMIVDSVEEVRTIEETDIESPPPIVMTINSRFITSIAKIQNAQESNSQKLTPDRLIILLDLPNVLTTREKTDLVTFEQQMSHDKELEIGDQKSVIANEE